MNCPNCGLKISNSGGNCLGCGMPLKQPKSKIITSDGAALRTGPSAGNGMNVGSLSPELRVSKAASSAESGLRVSKSAASSASERMPRVSGRRNASASDSELRIGRSAQGTGWEERSRFAGTSGPEQPTLITSPTRTDGPVPSIPPIVSIASDPIPADGKEGRAFRSKKRKQSPVVTALVVLLALGVLAAAVYLPYRFLYLPYKQSRPLTRTEVVERYLQAVLERDPKTAFSYTPFAGDDDLYKVFQQQVLSDDGGKAKKDLKEKYGKYTVQVQIEEKKEYAQDVVDKVLTLLSMNYQFGGYKLSQVVDTNSIAEVVQVKGTCTIKGKKGSDSMPFTATVIQYEDEWKVLDSSMTDKYSPVDIPIFLP